MAGDDRNYCCRNYRRAFVADSANCAPGSNLGGIVIPVFQRLRALLCLRFARRTSGVQLLWRDNCESVRGKDCAQESWFADSGFNRFLRRPSVTEPLAIVSG